MAFLRQCFARPLEFLRVRLSPRGYLGLHLTVGVLLLIGAAWLFGVIAEDVVTGDPLTVIDRNVSEWFHEHRTPGMTAVMQITTHFASLL